MCVATRNAFGCFIFTLLSLEKCTSDLLPPPQPSLVLFSPNETEYTEVIVRQQNDNLTLVCERRGSELPQRYVWNYLPQSDSGVSLPLLASPAGLARSSKYVKLSLQLSDSGHYICSVPPHSVTKYLLVQPKGPPHCSRVAFWCGARCVLPTYVCDGRRDCARGEDEAPALCGAGAPCQGADKLNCSSGRCISAAACCQPGEPLCKQPYCCEEHPRHRTRLGYGEVEYPALFEDRHAPDDYGFIQSTIYTVTACALIFMIAVVLLVSAICKMHMKRAALRSYTQQGQQRNVFQSHRFPPCYEASRLLDERARAADPASAHGSPAHAHNEAAAVSPPASPRAPLSRLGAVFSSRYRQVPTVPPEVEMQSVRCSSLQNSPTRRLNNYRSPTYCDLNTDFYFASPESADCGRDLNYMATPIEFYRRRTLTRNNPIDRILDQISCERPRPLTLQLGRFQLSIPRFGRRNSSEDRRPDTPNVAEINIDDLDFVRLNSNETYTLNGRTIRLLGANFENYPSVLDNRSVVCGPPQYDEAMRYKLYGPPPEYLSRDTLSESREANGNVDDEARSNIEMPPRYEDLASGVDNANSNTGNVTPVTEENASAVPVCDIVTSINGNSTVMPLSDNGNGSMTLSAVMDNLPAIDSDVNANEPTTGYSVVDNYFDNGNVVIVNDNE